MDEIYIHTHTPYYTQIDYEQQALTIF